MSFFLRFVTSWKYFFLLETVFPAKKFPAGKMVLCIMEFRNAFPASFLLLPVKLLRFHWLICTPVGSRSRCRLRYCIGQANNNSFDCFFHSLILSFPENCWFREAFLFLLAKPGIIMLLRNSKCQKRDNTQEKWGKINKNSFVPYGIWCWIFAFPP